jgi:hypothetical protein
LADRLVGRRDAGLLGERVEDLLRKACCSLPPQSDMTVIFAPAVVPPPLPPLVAAEALAPGVVAAGAQAVATRSATRVRMVATRRDLGICFSSTASAPAAIGRRASCGRPSLRAARKVVKAH